MLAGNVLKHHCRSVFLAQTLSQPSHRALTGLDAYLKKFLLSDGLTSLHE